MTTTGATEATTELAFRRITRFLGETAMRRSQLGSLGLGALLLASLLTGGCSHSDFVDGSSGSGSGTGTGRVRMVMGGPTRAAAADTVSASMLADDHGSNIESAEITIARIVARNLGGQLIDVGMELPVSVDLITLVQGGTFELPAGSLAVGSYDQLIVVIGALQVTLSNGTVSDVDPPGGGWMAIVRTDAFDVVEGEVTTLNLHFRAEHAFKWTQGQLEFDPEFDCDHDHDHE